MKKTLMIALVLAFVSALMIAGMAFAQEESRPNPGLGPGDGSGPLHEYMLKAIAEAVNLSVEEFETRHDAGETFYQIALAEGFQAEEVPALMQAAREKALEAAVADGVLTKDQAEWMKSRGYGRGGMMGGYGNAAGSNPCPMWDGDQESFDGGYGPGRMGAGRGGRWQQNSQ